MPESTTPARSRHAKHAPRMRADNINGLTNRSIRRLARRGGIKRIKSSIYETVRELTEAKVREIVYSALQYTKHAGRKTVTTLDVVLALQKTPGIVTERPLPIFGAYWYPVHHPRQGGNGRAPVDVVVQELELKKESPELAQAGLEVLKTSSTVYDAVDSREYGVGTCDDVLESVETDYVLEVGHFNYEDDLDEEEVEGEEAPYEWIDTWRYEVAAATAEQY